MSADKENAPVHMVLGATGNLGSAVSRRVAAGGSRLIIAAHDGERLAALSDELRAPAMSLDATRFDHVEAALEHTRRSMGRLDGVVSCVGTRPVRKDVADITPDEWLEILAKDLTSAVATVRAAATVRRHHGGSGVLCSGAATRVGFGGLELWSAAKSGVEGLVRSAASAYARFDLRFNCVAPGPLADPAMEGWDPEMTEVFPSALPLPALGREGGAEETAAAATWLLAPEQGWITGQVFRVDGGLSCCRD